MRQSLLLGLIVALIIAVAAITYSRSTKQQGSATPSPTFETENTPLNDQNLGIEGESPTPESQSEVMVNYTDSGFNPRSITVTPGTTVNFINSISRSVRIVSDPHPFHTDYPGFDSQRSLTPGSSYSFTFITAGSWGYHNEENVSEDGRIVVSATSTP